MRRGFLLSRKRESTSAPYPTRNKKPNSDDRTLFAYDAPQATEAAVRPYTVKDLKTWSKRNICLADDPRMSAKVDLRDLGADQRLIFRNIKVGSTEVSTLLDCAVLNLLPTRFSPAPIALENATELRSAGVKGMGVFAVQDLRAAALIHVEYPATITQNTLVLNFGITRTEVYRELVQRVPAKTRSALLQLNSSQLAERCDVEEGILRSNAVGIVMPAPSIPSSVAMGHNALFIEARFNHSCSPNVVHRFDPESFALSVHTIRPIAKGEEIVFSYIDLNSTVGRDARRSLLQNRFHFECMCDRCAIADSATVEESDQRRQRICAATHEEVIAPFAAWYRANGRGDLQKVIAFHLAAVEERRIEGLYQYPYLLHLSLLAICFAALEDIRSFRLWMGKARDVAVRNLETEKAVNMLRYVVYPESFPQWALARKMQPCPGAL
ncbi:hypothetical protein B0H15DRAFT_520686 [Mycena belliarum]|uniref:SET domain-containing protein n=1 Tax=Mycena belliarum TaxID=1033014 RepID=A0AAD6XLV0_9AGAR|nr:hypothetical protein B0H15DRAFT_520686 [Mycena belliae]